MRPPPLQATAVRFQLHEVEIAALRFFPGSERQPLRHPLRHYLDAPDVY
jgi:hypothetical protein